MINELRREVKNPADLSATVVNRALGAEIRLAREERGWTREQFCKRLPVDICSRTLLSYEQGTRQMTAVRVVEIARGLRVDPPALMARALQRARVYLESMTITVDLRALLRDGSGTFRPMVQWARNTLNTNHTGIVEVESVVVANLALFIGCTHRQLADYLARFLPDDD